MRRNWNHWEKWECVPAGMYNTLPPSNLTPEQAFKAYAEFLNDLSKFSSALEKVLSEWPVSCKQFLTNRSINRIAWLGQASMCCATGVPSKFKSGFSLLATEAQDAANALAEKYLKAWESEYRKLPHYFFPETETPAPAGMQNRILHYLKTWKWRGYEKGIPDEVPPELMRLNLAPSHKAIALAILKNDHSLSSLGYSQPVSPWYSVIKKIELENRNTMADPMF